MLSAQSLAGSWDHPVARSAQVFQLAQYLGVFRIFGGIQIEGLVLKQIITNVQSAFDHMVEQTVSMLRSVEDDVSNRDGGQGASIYATSHVEVSVSTVGPGNFAGAWMAQGFFVEADMQVGPYPIN